MELTQVEVNTSKTEAEKQGLIADFIQEHSEQLFRSLCVYVSRSNLAVGSQIEPVATELTTPHRC